MKSNYFEERDEKNIERFRAVLDELPQLCTEFFLGIQNRTAVLTRLNYAYDLRIFFDFLCKRRFKTTIDCITLRELNQVTQTDLELFMEYLNHYEFDGKRYRCNERAKERKLSTLRTLFKYFFNKDKLEANVASKVASPKIHQKEIVKLEVDEVVKLLDNVESGKGLTEAQLRYNEITKGRDSAILTLLLGTGIRVSECVGLDVDDIDFNTNGFLVRRKGGNKTVLYFSYEVSRALKQYLIDRLALIDYIVLRNNDNQELKKSLYNEPALFISSHDGRRISVRAVQLLVKKYSSTVTSLKKISPHKLRSTFGTNLYNETKDIYVVADVLGHADINTTKKHYASMSDEIRRKAANAVKLREDDDN